VFLYGLYFFLHSIDSFEVGGHLVVASTFVIVGTAFLMVWLNDMRDWYYLIPAFLSGAVGGALFLSEVGYLSHWEVLDAVSVYWPLVLILFGVGMIMRRRMQHTDQDVVTSDTPGTPVPPAPAP
jgi:hypothetical protein